MTTFAKRGYVVPLIMTLRDSASNLKDTDIITTGQNSVRTGTLRGGLGGGSSMLMVS